MEILELFKHADTFAQMEMGDKLLATGYVIILGMGITFFALILIWALTALMSRILMSVESKNQPAIKEVKKPAAPKPEVVEAVVEEDDLELVAVITAAVAASMNTSMHNIVVSKITRLDDTTPVWGKMGRNDVMASRY